MCDAGPCEGLTLIWGSSGVGGGCPRGPVEGKDRDAVLSQSDTVSNIVQKCS